MTQPGHVRLTQYMTPDGRPVPVVTDVGAECATLAEGMVLSCEVLVTGRVMLYAYYADEDEDTELNEEAENGPGDNTPAVALRRLIRRLHARRYGDGGKK